jgi:hypothetical protein
MQPLRLWKISLLLFLFAASAARAQGLYGEYFDNQDFTNRVFARVDPTLNFNFGEGAPGAGIAPESFSIRWTGEVVAPLSESFTFITSSDDGIRVWVDGKLLINNFAPHAVTEDIGTPIALVSGRRYRIRIEYYDQAVFSVVQLSWMSPGTPRQIVPATRLIPAPAPVAQPAGTGTGLQGDYFDEEAFTSFKVRRTDPTVDFSWAFAAPAPGVDPDTFSVRWSGEIAPRFSEEYWLITTSDDAVRVWLDETLVIDHNVSHPRADLESPMLFLTAGKRYKVRMEFREGVGEAFAILSWRSDHTPREVIPTRQLYPMEVPPAGAVGIGDGLRAEYFDNPDFTALKLDRVDALVDFDWGTGAPHPSMGPDTFSVRWSGDVVPRRSESYRFVITSDEAVRLWVGGKNVLDRFSPHTRSVGLSEPLVLTAGLRYPILIEYFDVAGDAVIKLDWESVNTPRERVPTGQLFAVSETGGGADNPNTDVGRRPLPGSGLNGEPLEPSVGNGCASAGGASPWGLLIAALLRRRKR